MEGRKFFNENKIANTPDQLHCCTLNCGTGLCPKHRLFLGFQESHSFKESVDIFKKIHSDTLMIETQKPQLYKKVINKMIQQAQTIQECDQILHLLQSIPDVSKDNFADVRLLVASKKSAIETQK